MFLAEAEAIARARQYLIDAGVPLQRTQCPHVVERSFFWGFQIAFRNVRDQPPRSTVVHVGGVTRHVGEMRYEDTSAYDPQEDDPALNAAFLEADRVAVRKHRWVSGMGHCHYVWEEKERVLRDRFGIEWKSPARMNPDITYD